MPQPESHHLAEVAVSVRCSCGALASGLLDDVADDAAEVVEAITAAWARHLVQAEADARDAHETPLYVAARNGDGVAPAWEETGP